MSGDLLENFLTNNEKQQIIGSYTRVLELLKPDLLMPKLVQNGHMSMFEKNDFKHKTDNEKGQFIIDNVFLKSTYKQLAQIRRCLAQSKTPGHTEIARLLPSRGESLKIESDSPEEPRSSCSSEVFTKDQYNDIMKASGSGSDLCHEGDSSVPPTSEGTPSPSFVQSDKSLPPADLSISNVSGIHTGNFDSGPPDIGSLSLNAEGPSQPMTSSPITKSSFSKQLSSSLGYYPVKQGNPQGTGEALVVVLANFTDNLFGYNKDIEDIVGFFKEGLKYKHVYAKQMYNTKLTNLCREEMLSVLKVIQDFLTHPFSGSSIDRFYLFLLSHGNEEGILTCKKGSMHEVEYDQSDCPVIVTIQEIVDMFTHDEVPLLKGYPKVVFRQTCQGNDILKAATLPSQPSSVSLHPTKLSPPNRPLAVGADVLICEASSMSHMSFVSDKSGSLFIQTVLNTMKQHHRTDHLIDILGEVNRVVAISQKVGEDPTSKKHIKAHQMPGIISRLTAKLYLKGPPMMFS